MSKLKQEDQFLDLSDYLRPIVKQFIILTRSVKYLNAINYTTLFILCGFAASYLIIQGNFILAALLLQLKNFFDAADGEWARYHNKPSMVGRYYDSIGDFIVNALLFGAVWWMTNDALWVCVLACLFAHLQVSLYNFYAVTYRHKKQGNTTSRVIEFSKPDPLPTDNPLILTISHQLFLLIYGWQDWIVMKFSPHINNMKINKQLLSFLSIFGLGTQLLIITILLLINRINMFFDMIFGLTVIAAAIMVIVAITSQTRLHTTKS